MEHASKMPAHRQQNKSRIAGLMLAGGRGARLGGIDKGLLDYAGLGLAEHVARRVAPQVGSLSISCNRNHQPYNALAEKYRANTTGPSLPLLVEDTALPQFSGPLAGLFSMLEVIRQSNLQARSNAIEWLFVCCCDNPRLPLNTVERLLHSLHHNEFNAAYPLVGRDHMRLCLLLEVNVALKTMQHWKDNSGHDYSVKNWLLSMSALAVPFPDSEMAINVNRKADLSALQNHSS